MLQGVSSSACHSRTLIRMGLMMLSMASAGVATAMLSARVLNASYVASMLSGALVSGADFSCFMILPEVDSSALRYLFNGVEFATVWTVLQDQTKVEVALCNLTLGCPGRDLAIFGKELNHDRTVSSFRNSID